MRTTKQLPPHGYVEFGGVFRSHRWMRENNPKVLALLLRTRRTRKRREEARGR